MIGGPYQTAQEIPVAMHSHPSNHPVDIAQLISMLISEIRTTLNWKIDTLQEKIEHKNEENNALRNENKILKEKLAVQEEKIAQLTQKENKTSPTSNTTTLQIQSLQNKQRGLRAHNLIITCMKDDNEDLRQMVQEIFMNKFHKKPQITAVQDISPMDKRIGQNEIQEASTSTSDVEKKVCKLLVTLNSVWELNSIYKQRVQALKGTGIYIGEDLNREESYLFYLARQLKKQKIISNTCTEQGNTYILEMVGTNPRILNINDTILQKLKSETKLKISHKQETTPDQELNMPTSSHGTEKSHIQTNNSKITVDTTEISDESQDDSSDTSLEVIVNQKTKEKKLKKGKARKTRQQKDE